MALLVAAVLFGTGCQSAGAAPDRGPSPLAQPRPAGAAVPATPAGRGTATQPPATARPGVGPVAQLPPGAVASPTAPPGAAPQPVPSVLTPVDLLRQGEAAFGQGDLGRAQGLYEELLARYPGDPLAASALFRLGEVALQRGDFELARRRFEELLVQSPTSPLAPSARYRLAYAGYRLGNIDDAVELLKGLTASNTLDPLQSAQALLLLGQGYEETRRPAEAARTYARLLAGAPPEEFRVEADRKLAALFGDDRLGRADLDTLAAGPPSAAAAFAKLRLAQLAIRDNDFLRAEALARELTATPAPPGVTADLASRAQAVLDEALRHVGVDPTVIGVVLPLSGRYQTFGERLLHGLMQAVGVFSTPVAGDPGFRLAVRDSGGNPAAAARAIEELVSQERAIAIVGPLLNAPAEEAAKTAQRLGVPLLTLTQRPKVTDIGPFVFRPFTTLGLQAQGIARAAMEREGLSRFVVLYPEDPSGIEMMEAFRAEVVARGGTVTDAVAYKPKQTDFGKEIRQIAKVKQSPRTRRPKPGEPPPAPSVTIEFDALFIPDYYDRVGLIAPQLAFYDVKGIRLLGFSGWNAPDLVRLGREHVDGALFVDAFWADSPTPAIRDFVDRFKTRFDETPTVLEAQAYDALRMLLDTIRRARPASRDQLRQALAAVQGFPGLTGPFGFGPTREPQRPLLLLTIENRRIRQVN
jgi:ABC-type branched-subunit amino acid transport system substrate-binding protein